MNEPHREYRAERGDLVVIDRGTENEIEGTVESVDGGQVTVRATRVKLRGQPRPDFVGLLFYPYQNGVELPWGPAYALVKRG